VLAALSLVGYVPVVRTASAWNVMVRMSGYDFPYFWGKVGQALFPGGSVALPVWSAMAALAALGGGVVFFYPRRFSLTEHQRDVTLFAWVSLLVGSVGVFVFLRVLSYYTAPWYYLALLALVAVCTDAILGAIVQRRSLRIARLVVVVVAAIVMVVPSRQAVRQRLTDVDVIADTLRAVTQPRDLVVVSPWHVGVTLTRYYRGAAPWVSVPILGSLSFVRYDSLKKTMMFPDQAYPARLITDRVRDALRNSGRVYFVGIYPELGEGQLPRVLPPAPWPGDRWDEGAHEKEWDTMVRYYLGKHSVTRNRIPISVDRVVSSYERMTVDAYEGWRP
jgi:hypothetical protein